MKVRGEYMGPDALSLLRDVVVIASSTKNMDLNTKIMQIQSEMYSLLDENRNLRLENERLKNKQIKKSQYQYTKGAYYKGDDGPFCPVCFEKDDRAIHMKLTEGGWNPIKKAKCHVCGALADTDIPDPNHPEFK